MTRARNLVDKSRAVVFGLELFYLALLLLFALIYWSGATLGFSLDGDNLLGPHRSTLELRANLYCLLPNPVGAVPLEIPWFGALGGVLISLQGVTTHRHDWDPAYKYWHWARPLIGAAVAVIAFFIFIVVIQASGSTVNFPGPRPTPGPSPSGAAVTTTSTSPGVSGPPSPRPSVTPSPETTINPIPDSTRRCVFHKGPSPARIPPPETAFYVYYAVAFLVGYREETFRELLRRLVDLIIGPGETKTAASPLVVKLAPKEGENKVGEEHQLRAMVSDSEGNVRAGVAITFKISGPHSRPGKVFTTDETGTAMFVYKGEKVGEDLITAFLDLNSDETPQTAEPQDTARKVWKS